MVVAATLLDGELGADTVSSAEDHLGCIRVAGPVPGLLSEGGEDISDHISHHISVSTSVEAGAATMDCPPCAHLFKHLLFVFPSMTRMVLMAF